MNELEKTELETVKFLRGKYQLNEIPLTCSGIPCVKFRQGSRTIVSIDLYKNHYVFQIVFGKTEQEKFESARHGFSSEIQSLYDSTHTNRAILHNNVRILD